MTREATAIDAIAEGYLDEYLELVPEERVYLGRILSHFEGHRTAAAQAAGLSYPTFLKRLRDCGREESR